MSRLVSMNSLAFRGCMAKLNNLTGVLISRPLCTLLFLHHHRVQKNQASARTNHCFRNKWAAIGDHLALQVPLGSKLHSTASLDNICWQCGKSNVKDIFFCDHCDFVQEERANLNYFEVFGLPIQFDIDTKALRNIFLSYQNKLHPDKFSQSTKTEQKHAGDQSALLNHAYNTLLKPLPRALYLLGLVHCPISESDTDASDPDFLIHMFCLGEEVDEAKNYSSVLELDVENKREMKQLMTIIAKAFKTNDYEGAKASIVKLKYYVSLDERIRSLEEKSRQI